MFSFYSVFNFYNFFIRKDGPNTATQTVLFNQPELDGSILVENHRTEMNMRLNSLDYFICRFLVHITLLCTQ